jgi:hypothetical protein
VETGSCDSCCSSSWGVSFVPTASKGVSSCGGGEKGAGVIGVLGVREEIPWSSRSSRDKSKPASKSLLGDFLGGVDAGVPSLLEDLSFLLEEVIVSLLFCTTRAKRTSRVSPFSGIECQCYCDNL